MQKDCEENNLDERQWHFFQRGCTNSGDIFQVEPVDFVEKSDIGSRRNESNSRLLA